MVTNCIQKCSSSCAICNIMKELERDSMISSLQSNLQTSSNPIEFNQTTVRNETCIEMIPIATSARCRRSGNTNFFRANSNVIFKYWIDSNKWLSWFNWWWWWKCSTLWHLMYHPEESDYSIRNNVSSHQENRKQRFWNLVCLGTSFANLFRSCCDILISNSSKLLCFLFVIVSVLLFTYFMFLSSRDIGRIHSDLRDQLNKL